MLLTALSLGSLNYVLSFVFDNYGISIMESFKWLSSILYL